MKGVVGVNKLRGAGAYYWISRADLWCLSGGEIGNIAEGIVLFVLVVRVTWPGRRQAVTDGSDMCRP